MKPCTLTDVIADALQSPVFAMSTEIARLLAAQIICAAAERGHAGCDYYLPSAQHLSRDERNARIRAEFDGTNLKAICRKYDVSTRTVYRACRRFGA